MKPPFPGMDPFIETSGLGERFHNHLIEAIYQNIARVLPKDYTVDTAVRSYIVLMEAEGKKEYLAKPDVALLDSPRAKKKKPGKKKGGSGRDGQRIGTYASVSFVEI